MATEIHDDPATEAAQPGAMTWTLALLATLAVSLGGFWFLLGWRYSPETYVTEPTLAGQLELIWFGLAAIGSVFALVIAARSPAAGRAACLTLRPLALAGLWVLGKTAVHWPLQCYDAMLFAAAAGAVAVGWFRQGGAALLSAEHRRWMTVAVIGCVLALGVYYIAQQFRALNAMMLGYADCGEMARLMFNTGHNPRELFLQVNPELPMFYDHFQPGILPFVLIGALWPNVAMTAVLQIVVVLVSAVPLYLIGRDVLRDRVAGLLLVGGWLAYPAASQYVYCSSYGFHFFNFNLPLYFFALWCWLRGRNGWALALALWTVMIKEEAAILVGMFGMYLFLFERKRVAGAALAAGGFAWFLVASSVLIPHFAGGAYRAMSYFGHLGGTKLEILMSPLTKPDLFWGKLFERGTFCFAGALLAPLLFLPLRKPKVLFIGSIPFLFLAEWFNPMGKGIAFWYQTSLLALAFLALVLALRDDEQKRAKLAGVIVAGIVLSIFLGNTFWSKQGLAVPGVSPGRLAQVRRLGAAIDRRGPMVATQRIAAHFISQRHLYLDPALPAETEYVFMDLRDRWRRPGNLVWLRTLRDFQKQVEARVDLPLVGAEDGLLLFARNGQAVDRRALVERDALPAGAVRNELDLGLSAHIVGYTMKQSPSVASDRLTQVRVAAYSRTVAPTTTDVVVRCLLTFGDESFASEFQPLGQGIWPMKQWAPDKLALDEFVIEVPTSLLARPVVVQFIVADLVTGVTAVATPPKPDGLPRNPGATGALPGNAQLPLVVVPAAKE